MRRPCSTSNDPRSSYMYLSSAWCSMSVLISSTVTRRHALELCLGDVPRSCKRRGAVNAQCQRLLSVNLLSVNLFKEQRLVIRSTSGDQV